MAAIDVNPSTAGREMTFTRLFDAPREMVFQAWTDPKHVIHWFGPHGFTSTIEKMDLRPGGEWRLVMRGPDGRDYHNRNVFIAVERPSKLVYRHEPEPGSEPVCFETTITLEEEGPRTRLTLRTVFPSAEEYRDNVRKYESVEGAKQTLERLAAHIGSKLFLTASKGETVATMTRMLDAPRALVFEAWTKPEHVARWWGRTGSTLAVCEIDLRPGGAWRFVERSAAGALHPFRGEYREIAPPERIVNTFIYDVEGGRDHPVLVTTRFEDCGGKTKLTQTIVCPTVQERDALVDAQMEVGANESFARLDQSLLAIRRRELTMTRTFDAPRDLVFRAFLEPDRLRRWFGPQRFSLPVSEFEPRVGGALRMQMQGPDGKPYPPLVGQVRELIAPARLVFSGRALNAAGEPIFEAMNLISFEETNGKTSVTLYAIVLSSTPEGDVHIKGMEQGWGESFDRLAAELAD